MKKSTGFALVVALILSVLWGCGGGGGGGGQPGTQVRITLHWAERSKVVNAPSSALSAVVTLKNAKADGSDFTFPINRDATITTAYDRTYTSVDFAMPGTWELTVRFHAQANGQGDVVGIASANVTLAADGSGIGDIATTGTVASVEVAADQTVFVGARKDLAFTVRDANNTLLAVTPGSAFFKVVSGADKLKITETHQAEGLAAGTATVTATVDGKVSPEAAVSVALSVSVSVNPTTVTAGDKSTGTVTLALNAPAGGAVVTLASNNAAVASVPTSVTVAAGEKTKTFTVTTHAVAENTEVTITAAYIGESQSTKLTVTPAGLQSVAVTPTSVAGGVSANGKITLDGEAPPGGAVVTLTSSNTTVATVPASVTVPEGANTVNFTVTTMAVSEDIPVTISATYAGTTKSAALTVKPLLGSVKASPSSVAGGNTSTGTVNFLGPAPAGGAVVTLTSSNTTVATVPESVTVPQGATSATFTINTSAVTENKTVTISASYSGTTKTETLTIKPLLGSVTVPSNGVVGGLQTTGTVDLNGPAPSGGVTVTLSSSNTTIASVPASVTLAQNDTKANFTITTTVVTSNQNVTITASYGGTTRTDTLTVRPYLGGLSLAPSVLIGGESSTGTVTLNNKAPAGGAVVTLASSNTTVATVPASVTVPEGAITANFTVTTTPVTSNKSVDITASYAGSSRKAGLSIRTLLDRVTLNPTTVTGGSPSTGTVFLNGPAPAGGAEITLSSSNPTVATVPASVMVPAGKNSVDFTVTTTTVTVETTATIRASKDGVSRNAQLTIKP